jgi:hypothetical protein
MLQLAGRTLIMLLGKKKENTAFVPLTISEVAKKTLKRPTNSEVLLQRFQRAHFKTCFFSTFLW